MLSEMRPQQNIQLDLKRDPTITPKASQSTVSQMP